MTATSTLADATARHQMVERQLVARGVRDQTVFQAMREVPREAFMPADLAEFAYVDAPLPIAEGQTISHRSSLRSWRRRLRR